MFGKKKENQEEILKMKELAELDEHFFEQSADGKDMFDATAAEMEESFKQAEADLNQLSINIQTASELAAGNVEVEADLTRQLAEYKELSERNDREVSQALDQFTGIQTELTRLVDDNKHFTSPSKYFSELPAALKTQSETERESLEQMESYGKRMGVLALNAAIEAGRLGDAGKQFVTAAEDIRVCASDYDKLVADAGKRLAEADTRIAELEEQVHRLVTLLKENNVSTAKLMKKCNEAVRNAQETIDAAAGPDLSEISNQVTVLRNADEEIMKSEERNRMQVEDLTEEFSTEQKNHGELMKAVDPLYRHVVERKAAGA